MSTVTWTPGGNRGATMRSSSSTTSAGSTRVVPAPPRPAYASSWSVSSAARRPVMRMFSIAERPGVARRNLAQREIGVAEHGDEQVVEVVRESAGEHAEALGALRIHHAALERRARGDIDERAERADHLAVAVAIRSDRRSDELAAVLAVRLDDLACERAAMRVDRVRRRRIGRRSLPGASCRRTRPRESRTAARSGRRCASRRRSRSTIQ